MRFVVIYDACILYPAPLRDLLMRLATTRLFAARWTEQIHDEWRRSLLKKRPELAGALPRTVALMNQAVPDALVTGHEPLIQGLTLSDQADQEGWPAARLLATLAEHELAERAQDLPDPAMTLAAVDRLVHHATLFELNVDSYRRRTVMDNRRSRGRPATRATLKTSHTVSLSDTDANDATSAPGKAG